MADSSRFTKRLASFGYAFRGIGLMLRFEPNARIHAVATAVALAAGLALEIDRSEWLVIVLTIALVWSLEALNTAIEAICDLASPEHHPLVERAKDVGAGAVLIGSVAAVLVAALIFGGRLLALAGISIP